jgi:hypothetical protein
MKLCIGLMHGFSLGRLPLSGCNCRWRSVVGTAESVERCTARRPEEFWDTNSFLSKMYYGLSAQVQSGLGVKLTTLLRVGSGSLIPWSVPYKREVRLRHGALEVFALLGCYGAWVGTSLPTFRDKIWTLSARVKKSKTKVFFDCFTLEDGTDILSRNVSNQPPTFSDNIPQE